jgi:quercetin dioxygenase-like cupin family protein
MSHNTDMSTSTELTHFASHYPNETFEGLPADLFAPIEGDSLFIRESRLRKKIDQLQDTLAVLPQLDLPVTNTFAGGVYARELFIPKGTFIIGKVHLTDHFNICLKGDLTFLSVDGPKRIVGPTMFVAPAGTKKVAYANEDSIWTNMMPALSEDPEKIVDALTVIKFSDFDCLMSKADLEYKVGLFGFTPEHMHELSVDPSTLDDSPLEGVEVKDSEIHGKGLFSTRNFEQGDVICLGVYNNKRTLAGRYTNHSPTPNANTERRENKIVVVALQNIEVGDEITTDYGETLALLASEKEFV